MLTRLQRPLAKMDRMKAADAKNDGPKQPTPDLDALLASLRSMGVQRNVRRMQQGHEFSSVPAWNENKYKRKSVSLSTAREPESQRTNRTTKANVMLITHNFGISRQISFGIIVTCEELALHVSGKAEREGERAQDETARGGERKRGQREREGERSQSETPFTSVFYI